MAKRKFYDMDRATLVRLSSTMWGLYREYQPDSKHHTDWTPAQKRDMAFLVDQIQVLLSVVNHLNEIVQNDGQ